MSTHLQGLGLNVAVSVTPRLKVPYCITIHQRQYHYIRAIEFFLVYIVNLIHVLFFPLTCFHSLFLFAQLLSLPVIFL